MRRGSIVYNIADPKHHGIIKSIMHRGDYSFATVRWLDTGWISVGEPLGELRLADVEADAPTEVEVLRARLS